MSEDLKYSTYDFTKIPFDNLVRVGQRTMLHRDLFTVSWLLGRYCNYRCSYCWPYARSDKKDFRPTELCLLTIDEIKRQARDTREKMQVFADKLVFCQEHDVQVTINQVMVPEWFDRDWDNALFFHNQGINCTLKPMSDPTASKIVDGYTPEMLKALHNGMPQRGYTEDKAKKSMLVTRPNGSVKRSYSCADQPLGNIETGFKLFDAPTVCTTNACVSSADSKIPKRAAGTQLPLFPGDTTFKE